MKRKVTELEQRLKLIGYKLECKTYCGKDSKKVLKYVYTQDSGLMRKYVNLNKTRDKITTYAFTINTALVYNDYTIEHLQKTNDDFHNSLNVIYDFEKGCIREDFVDNSEQLEDMFVDNALIEESYFDE